MRPVRRRAGQRQRRSRRTRQRPRSSVQRCSPGHPGTSREAIVSAENLIVSLGSVPLMTLEFDPFSPTYFEDPYGLYARMRGEAPVYFSERYGFYALSRYEDVVAAHKDWATFSS